MLVFYHILLCKHPFSVRLLYRRKHFSLRLSALSCIPTETELYGLFTKTSGVDVTSGHVVMKCPDVSSVTDVASLIFTLNVVRNGKTEGLMKAQ